MPLLVRKINRNKWPTDGDADVFKINSDAITNCLKSSKGTISVWKINEEKELDEAVLALASNFQHLEAIDVVMLDCEEIKQLNIAHEQTKGVTQVMDLEDRHFDLSNLNYYSIGLLAEHIAKRINQNKVKRYTIGNLKLILTTAIKAGRLSMSDLAESIAGKLPQ